MSYLNRFVALIVCFAIACPALTPLHPTLADDARSPKELLASTKTLAEQRRRVGAQLIDLLANEDADVDDRVMAAVRLGWVEYTPAIPTLIRYIDLEPTFYDETGMPVSASMRKFGFAAVPSLIQAYLEHHNDGSTKAEKIEFALTMAIKEQLLWPAGKATKMYLKGLALQTTDPAKKGKIEHLLNFDSEFGDD